MWLLPANAKYQPIEVTEANDFTVWGIVTYVIKKVCTR
jgi:DNA polymerase V